MKREDVKNKIPGITEEQLDWLMTENGSDINREKSAAAALQTRLDSAQAQVTKLQADMEAQSDGFAFDNALNAAILGAKGRSVPAVRALLDLDALKGSADRSTDISKALEAAAQAYPWAFGEAQGSGAGTYSTGAAHGTPPAGAEDTDPVETAFKKLNPHIKL